MGAKRIAYRTGRMARPMPAMMPPNSGSGDGGRRPRTSQTIIQRLRATTPPPSRARIKPSTIRMVVIDALEGEFVRPTAWRSPATGRPRPTISQRLVRRPFDDIVIVAIRGI